MIDTSIVMCTCSRAGLLRGALESLIAQASEMQGDIELVVVDDGSTDETPELLEEFRLRSPIPIKVIPGTRRGVAAARNLAASHATGAWLAYFDDDQLALSGWLRELRAAADATRAGVVGGVLLLQLPEGHSVDSMGPRTRRILGEHFEGDAAFRYRGNLGPATNNVLIRRDVFTALDGFDVTFTEGAEDADFFDRVAAGGHEIWYEPAARGLHLIPERRLERNNIRWTSLRIGACEARLLQRKRPVVGPLVRATVRVGATLLRDLPLLAFSTLTGNRKARRNVECSLWYSEGFLRALPAILALKNSTREEKESAFLKSLNFRARNGERTEVAAPVQAKD